MKKRCFFAVLARKLHSEKGTAAILTLSVILVLTALGTVSLLASVLNIRMSAKTISWSEDYYALDAKAEEYVHWIDENILIPAEKYARTYVINRLDKLAYDSVIMNRYFDDPDFAPSADAQNYFFEYYKVVWTDDDTGHEYTVQDYERLIADGDTSINDISRNYYKYRDDSTLNFEEKAANAYKDDLKDYTKELFDRVYYHMIAKRLEHHHDNNSDFQNARIIIKSLINENYDYVEATEEYRCTNIFEKIRVTGTDESDIRDNWASIAPHDGSITLYIRSQDSMIPNKKVHVAVEVTTPRYDVIEKTIYTPIKGNPIWANALTVRGSIRIGEAAGTHMATIKGDVYASGSSGISVYNDTTANIYGNVYTAGNVQVLSNRPGTGGTLNVIATDPASSGVKYACKRNIYGNEYLHENHLLYGIEDAYQYSSESGMLNIPFVFKDFDDRGNVYCESLEVAENVVGATLTVEGNLWTMDDIQMDGQGSTIRVGKAVEVSGKNVARFTYIGLNGESAPEDPNKSSSVINNFPFYTDGTPNSKIIINSDFLVPGVAFYHFFSNADPATRSDKFYRSIESVTARTSRPASLLNSYAYYAQEDLDEEEEEFDIFYNQDGDEFRLIDQENDPQRKALTKFIDDIGGVYTNVMSSLTEPAGYVAGTALIEKEIEIEEDRDVATVYTHNPSAGETPGAVALMRSTENYVTYQLLNYTGEDKKLFRLHTAKTKRLGKYVRPEETGAGPINFRDFINAGMIDSIGLPDIVMLRGDDETLDIRAGGITSGIVYCTGDLTITGDGTEFRGAIICEGDVTIEGNVKITYDEDVIYLKLKNNEKVRQFFSNGEMGDKLFDIQEYSTTSGMRVQVKRYRITAWKEIPVMPASP
jgi:hypothetical protein